MKKSNWQEKLNEKLYLISALISIALIFSITLFIFIKGVPAIKEIGIKNFILGTNWKPGDGQYGILPMIVVHLCYYRSLFSRSAYWTIYSYISK